MGNQAPTSLFGAQPAFVVGRVDQAKVAGADEEGRRLASLAARLARRPPDEPRGAGTTISGAQTFGAAPDTPAGDARHRLPLQRAGPGAVGRLPDRAVRLGTEVITVDQGDWDMHTDAGTLEWGDMMRNASRPATSIAAFFCRPRRPPSGSPS